MTFSAKVEAELAELPAEDRKDFLALAGPRPSRDSTDWPTPPITCSACRATSRPARRKCAPGRSTGATGRRPPPAVIHSDFEKGFIRAETVGYDDFVRVGGWKRRAGAGPRPRRRQGVRRAGRRRAVVPFQRLNGTPGGVHDESVRQFCCTRRYRGESRRACRPSCAACMAGCSSACSSPRPSRSTSRHQPALVQTLVTNRILFFGLIIAQLALVVFLSARGGQPDARMGRRHLPASTRR